MSEYQVQAIFTVSKSGGRYESVHVTSDGEAILVGCNSYPIDQWRAIVEAADLAIAAHEAGKKKGAK